MKKKVKKAQSGFKALDQKKLRDAEIAKVKAARASGATSVNPERVTGGRSTMSSIENENSKRFKNANVGKKSKFKKPDPKLSKPLNRKPLNVRKELSNVSKVTPMTPAQKASSVKMKAKDAAAKKKTALTTQLKTAPNGSAKRRNLYKKLGWKLDATTKVKKPVATLKAEKIKKKKTAMPTAKKVTVKAKPASKSTKRTLKKMGTLTKKRKVATAKGKTRKAKRISNRLARVTKRGVKRTARKTRRANKK
jgi:hypothetical protein